MTILRHPLRLALCGLTALMLLGAALPAPAEQLMVYTALEDDEIPGYLDLFKAAHPGIEVKIVRDSTGILTA